MGSCCWLFFFVGSCGGLIQQQIGDCYAICFAHLKFDYLTGRTSILGNLLHHLAARKFVVGHRGKVS